MSIDTTEKPEITTDIAGNDLAKLSAVEGFKTESNFLRGPINEELEDGNDFFGKSSIQLLKNHGTYQQDDRDARSAKTPGGKSSKAFSFMVRTRVPGGKVTAEQMLGELEIGDRLGNSTIRFTTRQGIQHHGIPKEDLKTAIRVINEIKLSTLAACGDVNRNVMCCPAPHRNDPVHDQMQAMADEFAYHLAPRTSGYYDIWLRDDETGDEEIIGGNNRFAHVNKTLGANLVSGAGANGEDEEPIYGPTYLPRKFKTAFGFPDDNCVDMYANDLGYMAIVERGQIVGYNVLVGGGMGVTPSAHKTFPALAKKLCFVEPDQVLDVGVAIVKVQRDYGNREDRKLARLKYTIANRGLDWFKSKVDEYYGHVLPGVRDIDVTGFDDHIGWREQGDGRYYYGLNIENGRIHDDEKIQLKSALREICRTLAVPMRITPHQSILFIDLRPEDRATLEGILKKHNVPLSETISEVRRWSMACVAKPTCGLAVAESERILPEIIDQLEVELAKLGLSKEVFTVRMTGCPNGCARPYNCDVGIVGKTDGKYTIFVGGRLLGDRMNFIYKDLIPTEQIIPTLAPLFFYFKQSREPGETVGDFMHRKGAADLLAFAENFKGG